jgi:hypothetical protein
MNADDVVKAAEAARSLLRDRPDVESVGVSRSKDGDFCVRVDVEPGTNTHVIYSLLSRIGAPVVVRKVAGILRAH